MSPDELQRLREGRLAGVEGDVRDVKAHSAAHATTLAVHTNTLEDHEQQLEALWDDTRKVRWLLIGAMGTVTTGAIGTALLVFIKVGGGGSP